MEIKLIRISNAICRSIKHLTANDALLTLQIIILGLMHAKAEAEMLKAEFDLADVTGLGLGIQYSVEELERLVNSGHLAGAVEIRTDYGSIPLIKCSICVGTKILIYFNFDAYDVVSPSEDYSLFQLHDLLSLRTAGGIALYMLLVSYQNTMISHNDTKTYEFDLQELCRILGINYSKESRPGRRPLDRLLRKALPNINSIQPRAKLSYSCDKTSYNRMIVKIQVTNLETVGINGLSPAETVNDGIPDFASDIGSILKELIDNRSLKHYKCDSHGRCISATAILTTDSVIPTGNMKSIRSVKPLGFDKVKHIKGKDDRIKFQKSHLIARRFSGEDIKDNLISGTVSLNQEMSKTENIVASYLKTNEGTTVLYRVEPLYEGHGVVPRKVRLSAMNLDKRDNSLMLSVEILNAEPGLSIDYGLEEV